jgi:hypothetical protein
VSRNNKTGSQPVLSGVWCDDVQVLENYLEELELTVQATSSTGAIILASILSLPTLSLLY